MGDLAVLGPDLLSPAVIFERGLAVPQFRGQPGQSQKFPRRVRLPVAPESLEHVQQVAELAALAAQLAVEVSQGGADILSPAPLGAGEAVHQVVQVFIAGQTGQEGRHDEQSGVVMPVVPQVFQQQVAGMAQVLRVRGMKVTTGHQGPLLRGQVGQRLQFLAGQLQGLGKIPAGEIGHHRRRHHRLIPGLLLAQAVEQLQGLRGPSQVGQHPGLLQAGGAVLGFWHFLQEEIIAGQRARQVSQPHQEPGLLQDEPGVFRGGTVLQLPGRLVPPPVLEQQADAPQAQARVVLEF